MKRGATRQTVDKALDLLERFSVRRPEWSVTELSAEVGLEKSIVSRILRTFAQRGFVEQDPHTRRYRLGHKVLELADSLRGKSVLSEHVKPIMAYLASRTQETAVFGLRRGWNYLCTEVVESQQGLRVGPAVGQQTPLHAGAVGKAILAYLSPAEQERYMASSNLRRFTDNTIVDPVALRRALEEIRKQGFATSAGELIIGVTAAAAPVFDASGEVIGSLGIDMPEVRCRPGYLAELGILVREASAELSARLGYRPAACAQDGQPLYEEAGGEGCPEAG